MKSSLAPSAQHYKQMHKKLCLSLLDMCLALVLLSLNTPGLQFPVTGFQPQCVCVSVEEDLGVLRHDTQATEQLFLLIAAIRPPETISESSMVNEECTVR